MASSPLQIIELLLHLRKELGLTYLFISHDLAIVRHLASRVAVMYQGEIIECGETDALYSNPQHPYTQQLLASSLNTIYISNTPQNPTF